jgi:HD-GYP domain-containing protein (c-di-GMP phosphodiesterase class II)
MAGLFKFNQKSSKTNTGESYSSPDIEESATNPERPAFIPSNIELSVYVDSRPVEEEVTPAIKAHQRAHEVLDRIVLDIKSNKHFAIESTEEVIHDVVNSMIRNPDAMMWVTRLRKQDEYVYGHGLQVAVYLVALGRHLGLPKPFLERLCVVGLLLDIGKIKLPSSLLLKKGRLDPEEFTMVKSHVQLALEILKDTPNLHPDILQGIAQHHERENGSGYPAGLTGEEISLFGRMSAIVDSFSALTGPRSYAETMPAYEAMQNLSSFNTGLYQSAMIEQFIQAIGVFPVGSMVELSSGEVAVVISHRKIRRLKPRVLIISDSNKIPSPHPSILDLLYQPQIEGNSEIYILRGLPTGAFGLDAREFYLT